MDYDEVVHLYFEQRQTHEEIAAILQQRHPGVRGLSARSVKRYCQTHKISRRSRLTEAQLDVVVHHAVQRVGHSYGRRTMQGLLSSHGIFAGERRVGRALQRVDPEAQVLRTVVTQRRFNPIPYHASHFGDKLHFDQNEKLNMFGVTHVLAIDGYSRKVVGFITIPVKNPVAIYAYLFRPLLLKVGIFDQVRTDKGREFDLMLAVQDSLSAMRRSTTKPSYKQTTSNTIFARKGFGLR